MVIKRLFAVGARRAPPAVPAGHRVYAIGDVHGRLDALNLLLAAIDADDAARAPAATTIVLLGDLVDRGPDSRGVIDRLAALAEGSTRFRFLLGNHDEVFLKAIAGDARAVRMLSRIGGKETLLSYGVSAEAYQEADYEALARMLADHVPAGHADFLAAFEDRIEIGDYLFVHAGIKPGICIADQALEDLRWIRSEFLDCRDAHEKMVVHGHSISAEVDIRRNRIGVDTGAFATGRLSAIGLEGSEQWVLAAAAGADPRWA